MNLLLPPKGKLENDGLLPSISLRAVSICLGCAPTFDASFGISSCFSDSYGLPSMSPLPLQPVWLPLKLRLIDAVVFMPGRALPSCAEGTPEPTEAWRRCAGATAGGPFVQRRFVPRVRRFTSSSTQSAIDWKYERVKDEKAEESFTL